MDEQNDIPRPEDQDRPSTPSDEQFDAPTTYRETDFTDASTPAETLGADEPVSADEQTPSYDTGPDDGPTASATEPVVPTWTEPSKAPFRAETATDQAQVPRILPMALAWLIAAVLGAGIGAGAMLYLADRGDLGVGRVNVVEPPVKNTSVATPDSAAAVAKAVLPSVVRLDVAQGFQGGVGSGVVYDDLGHIITNHHVVENASRIDVSLPNGETVQGEVVGDASPFVDIAVVKVDVDNLTPATFGSTKDIQVGEMAVALGSPYGLDATVTAGVVSALHRNPNLDPRRRLTDAIQTDAPINPGNSGGPLANARGEVIGINTAILGAEGNIGVGFAIPVEIARKVAEQIIRTGRAELAYLGIQGASIPDNGGARVIEVDPPGGPAGRAGIRREDIILELDGVPVESMNKLITLLIEKNVGDTVEIVVERDGRRITVQATLQARPTG